MDTDLIEKLTVVFARKRVPDFLRDFDKLHINRIYPDQAIRALSACGAVLTPAEQEQIKSAYTTSDGLFEYRKLMDDVDSTRPAGYFEQRPDIDPASTTPSARFGLTGLVATTATSLLPRAVLTKDEELELARVLNILRHDAHCRSIIISRYMIQYDVTHCGIITKSRFLRELLTCFRGLRPSDGDLLAKAYAAPDGQVRYMALHQDVTPDAPIAIIQPHRSTSPNVKLLRSVYGEGAAPRTSEQAKAVMESLVRQFFIRRIRSTDLFRGYDKLNKNVIARAMFIRGLGSCKFAGMDLSALEAVADTYADLGVDPEGGFVRWRDFCDDIEAAEYLRPTLVQLEQQPVLSNTTFAAGVMSGPVPGTVRPELAPEEKALEFAVMADIKQTITRYRLWRIADMLTDFDQLHEGHLSVDRFMRVLAMCSCAPTRPGEKEVLIKSYGGVGAKSGMMNYRAFLTDIDLKSSGVQGT